MISEREFAIERVDDAASINKIINHPDVFPYLAQQGQEELDYAPVVAEKQNVLLMAKNGLGGLLFVWREPLVYEVHTQFLPEAWGREAKTCIQDALAWMFTHTEVMEIHTYVPKRNVRAKAMAKMIGGEEEFWQSGRWVDVNGEGDELGQFTLTYARWARRAKGFGPVGEEFHSALGPHQSHPDDPTHNHYVGICATTLLAGQPEKAILLYNKWARRANYAQIRLLHKAPILIDICNAYLLVQGQDFQVIAKKDF